MAQVIQHPSIGGQKQSKTQELPIADSSYLMHVAYDAANLQMTVTMKNGAQYLYSQIPPDVMEEFTLSPSKGKFYADKIRGSGQAQRIIDKNIGPAVSKKVKKGRTNG